MENKKIYIFTVNSRATVYGIGSYIDRLTGCLQKTGIDFTVINLHMEIPEVTVTDRNGYREISIPSVSPTKYPNGNRHYRRNMAYLLKEFIPEEEGTTNIFHLNFMTDEYLVASLRKLFTCKIILTAHYTEWSFALLGDYDKLKKILKKPEKRRSEEDKQLLNSVETDGKILEQCDRTICVAQHTFDFFRETYGEKAGNPTIINNAMRDTYRKMTPEKRLSVREELLISPQTKVVLFAGRLDQVKGVTFVIAAFKKILKTHPDARLFIAGDGQFPSLLHDAGGCWSQISFTGRLDKKQLFRLYQIADIGVVSSLHEEFGYVAIEMMMHALPVIATDTGGLSEIFEDGISGLKIPVVHTRKGRAIDTENLAEKIAWMLDHPAEAEKIGKNGRQRFLKKYEIGLFRQKMLDIYNEL